MTNENEILTQWRVIKELVEALELDINKNATGVRSAGIRARRGLRELKVIVVALIRLMIANEKAFKAAVAVRRASEG
jgi:hypothetical protein